MLCMFKLIKNGAVGQRSQFNRSKVDSLSNLSYSGKSKCKQLYFSWDILKSRGNSYYENIDNFPNIITERSAVDIIPILTSRHHP